MKVVRDSLTKLLSVLTLFSPITISIHYDLYTLYLKQYSSMIKLWQSM